MDCVYHTATLLAETETRPRYLGLAKGASVDVTRVNFRH